MENNEDKRNVIELAEPPVTTYPSVANILSLLWDRSEGVLPWLCDHFIQIIVRPNHMNTYGDFYDHADLDNYFRIIYGIPGLGWMRANSECARFDVFTDYIEHEIDNGYCLEACLDRYYLSFTKNYEKEHFIHSTFIYGYDKGRKEVYIADFWSMGKYEKKVVRYDEINLSMNNDYLINLFKRHESKYELNKELMKKSFMDYYCSQDSFCKYEFSNQPYNKGVIFGLEYYDYMNNNLKRNEYPDIRLYHLIYDHKILMRNRLDYLKKLNEYDYDVLQDLSERNEQMITEALELRNCSIRYCFDYSERIYEKILEKTCKLKEMDKSFVKDILEIL